METNEMKSKKIKSVLNGFICALAVAVVVFAVLSSLPSIRFCIRYYAVPTKSMEPIIHRGSLIFSEDAKFSELEEGDIVTFRADVNLDGTKETVTHYFADFVTKDGDVYMTTRSAATGNLDSWFVPESDLIGKCIFVIPFAGKVSLYLSHPIGLICAASNLVILFVALFLLGKLDKKEEAEECFPFSRFYCA